MLLSIVAALTLAAPPKVAALGFTGAELTRAKLDLDVKARYEFFTEHFAGRLREAGFSVVTPSELSALLGLERQRELLGCGEASTSCMAELASALGADVVALGNITNLDEGSRQVSVKLLSASTGKVLAQRSGRVATDALVTDALGRAAAELGREALVVLRPNEAPPPMPDFSRRPLRRWSWLPAAVGLAGVGVGVGLLVTASGAHQRLVDPMGPPLSAAQADGLVQSGQASQVAGVISLGVAGAALGVAAAFFFWAEEAPRLEAVLVPTPQGLALVGVLP